MMGPAAMDVGLTAVMAGTGFSSATLLAAVTVESAALTALTVTVLFEAGTTAGAVYRPDEFTVPLEALPPATPFTCQVTA